MRRVSVGIIGAGFSAHLHAEGLAKVFGLEVSIAAVSAGDSVHAAQFAERHDIPRVYPSYSELLADPTIDVVCVCVPNAWHAEVCIDAANAGKHIICEKPVTGAFGDSAGLTGSARARNELDRAVRSAEEIAEAVRRNGVLFMYAENWIYAPAMTKIKRFIRTSQGSILDIRAEESHSGSHAPRSRRRGSAGGGALMMMGSHPIAAAIHLKRYEGLLVQGTPIEVSSVTAEVGRLFAGEAVRRVPDQHWLVSDWEDVETWANVVLSFSDGTHAVVTASFAMLGGVRNVLEVYTTNGAFRANLTPNDGLLVFTPDADAFGGEYMHEKVESRAGWNFASPDEDWVRGYPQEMQDFIECIANGREPVSDFSLARGVVDVIYASYLAAEEGRRVQLPVH